MFDSDQVISQLKNTLTKIDELSSLLKIEQQRQNLLAINNRLEDSEVWQNINLSSELSKKKTMLEKSVDSFDLLKNKIENTFELAQLADVENDEGLLQDIAKDFLKLEKEVNELEFHRLFSNELDRLNCYLEVQSGSGGTEAQDWAEMLLRQYLRWCERHSFQTEILDYSVGEVAGIKSASVFVQGHYAYGWLKTESGIHRLVRKSPFDSGNRRHTSFASIFISPEIDDSFEVDLNPADIRVDVYRASGAGGQHVNRTESAVRLTHLPSNTVTQCQNSRSQHANKAEAMKQLRAKLYDFELKKRNEKKQQLEDSKSDIGWGSQIRSYILDSGRVKDLRTGVETGNTQAVLDGDLDLFMRASLKQIQHQKN